MNGAPRLCSCRPTNQNRLFCISNGALHMQFTLGIYKHTMFSNQVLVVVLVIIIIDLLSPGNEHVVAIKEMNTCAVYFICHHLVSTFLVWVYLTYIRYNLMQKSKQIFNHQILYLNSTQHSNNWIFIQISNSSLKYSFYRRWLLVEYLSIWLWKAMFCVKVISCLLVSFYSISV